MSNKLSQVFLKLQVCFFKIFEKGISKNRSRYFEIWKYTLLNIQKV